MRVLVNFAYLKHVLLVGVGRCLDFCGLSLHPLKNFELVSSETLTRLHKSTESPEPLLITFVIWFHHARSSDSKKDVWALRRSSPCHTHTRVRSLDLIVAMR